MRSSNLLGKLNDSPSVDSELLETRRLMSASEVDAWVSRRGTLLIVGTESNDSIIVRRKDSWIYVRAGDDAERFKVAQVKRVRADLGGGHDFFHNYMSKRATVNGESGNDTVVGSEAYDSLDGGAGNDLLQPVAIGANFVNGGGGSDVLDYVSEAPGRFDLVSCYDRDDFGDLFRPLSVSRGGIGDSADTLFSAVGVTLRLSGGDDEVTGQVEVGMTIDMYGGNDLFTAYGADGDVPSTLPTVTIRGGAGNDEVLLQSEDTKYGGVFGDAGNDTIFETGGITSLVDGTCIADGGTGRDKITVAYLHNRDEYHIPDGVEDVAVLESGDLSLVQGNSLDNSIYVEAWGGVTIQGGNGNDLIRGGVEFQVGNTVGLIDGEGGNDTILPGFGPELIRGGSGTDVVRYRDRTAPASVTFDGSPNDGALEDEFSELPGLRDDVASDVELVD